MKVAFYGSSLLSSYWNGAATYYRGILKALAGHGYEITFYEPDAFERQQHRDIDPPAWARSVVYPATVDGVRSVLAEAESADIVVKANGVGVFDRELLEGVVAQSRPDALRIFWDVDAAATLDEMRGDPAHPVLRALPMLGMVLTYGGGPPVVNAYGGFGAALCEPIYNALDPETHHPAPGDPRFAADLALLANRLPDREARIEEFFLRPAAAHANQRFLLGGNGWDGKPMPATVTSIGHVGTGDHNAFNSTPRAVLNVARDSMAHGRLLAGDPRVRGRRCRCLHDHRCLGRDRAVPCPQRGSTGRSRWPGRRRASCRADPGAGAGDWRCGAAPGAGRAYLCPARGKSRSHLPRASPAGAGGGMKLVVLGLSLGSSWGNGHATTFRALLAAFAARGHDVLFLEREVPWYAGVHRDLVDPDFCRLAYYGDLAELEAWRDAIAQADGVIVGSYVPDGVAVGRFVQATAQGVTAFYDIDTPVTLARMARGDCDYLAPEVIPGYDLYLSFTGGPILRRIERQYGAPAARALYCSVDPAAYRPLDIGARLGSELSRHLQPRSPADAGSFCCSNPRGAARHCALPLPGRNTRTTSPGQTMSSASSICHQPTMPRSTARRR